MAMKNKYKLKYQKGGSAESAPKQRTDVKNPQKARALGRPAFWFDSDKAKKNPDGTLTVKDYHENKEYRVWRFPDGSYEVVNPEDVVMEMNAGNKPGNFTAADSALVPWTLEEYGKKRSPYAGKPPYVLEGQKPAFPVANSPSSTPLMPFEFLNFDEYTYPTTSKELERYDNSRKYLLKKRDRIQEYNADPIRSKATIIGMSAPNEDFTPQFLGREINPEYIKEKELAIFETPGKKIKRTSGFPVYRYSPVKEKDKDRWEVVKDYGALKENEFRSIKLVKDRTDPTGKKYAFRIDSDEPVNYYNSRIRVLPVQGNEFIELLTGNKESRSPSTREYQMGGMPQQQQQIDPKEILGMFLQTLSEEEQEQFIAELQQMQPEEQMQVVQAIYQKIQQQMQQPQMQQQMMSAQQGDIQMYKEGGTPRNGQTKRSTQKGKKMAVYMDGKWHHFGDSSMQDYRTHKSEKRRQAFYSRHKKNLQGDDPRSKAFRVYARKTWQEGGQTPNVMIEVEGGESVMLPNGELQRFEGPKHSEGGIPVTMPEGAKIYSEHLKAPKEVIELVLGKKTKKKYSYADLSKKFPTKPFEQKLQNPELDKYERQAALVKLENNRTMLETIFQAQETEKEMKNKKVQMSQNYSGMPMAQTGRVVETLYPWSPDTAPYGYTGPRGLSPLIVPAFPISEKEAQTRGEAGTFWKDSLFTTESLTPQQWAEMPAGQMKGAAPKQPANKPNATQGPVAPPASSQPLPKAQPTDWNNANLLEYGLQDRLMPEVLVEPSSTYTTGVVRPLINRKVLPPEPPQKEKPKPKPKTTVAPKKEEKPKFVPRLVMSDGEPPSLEDAPAELGTQRAPLEPTYNPEEVIEAVDPGKEYLSQGPFIPAPLPPAKKKFGISRQLSGSIFDALMAASNRLNVDEPQYRDNRKYPLFTRFVDFEDKEVGKNYNLAMQQIMNSNMPEQAKQAQIANLNAKLQDYQGKQDLQRNQLYQQKLNQDTDKLQAYMDRNVDQATADLENYRMKKARVEDLKNQFRAKRKADIVNPIRQYLDFVQEVDLQNQIYSDNFRMNPFTGKVDFYQSSQDPLKQMEQQMAQYKNTPQFSTIPGGGGQFGTLYGVPVHLDPQGRLTIIETPEFSSGKSSRDKEARQALAALQNYGTTRTTQGG